MPSNALGEGTEASKPLGEGTEASNALKEGTEASGAVTGRGMAVPDQVVVTGVEIDVLDEQGRRHRARLSLGGSEAPEDLEQLRAALQAAGYQVLEGPTAGSWERTPTASAG